MSCEQALVKNFVPKDTSRIIDTIKHTDIFDCSQKCCDNSDCAVFSYFHDEKACLHFSLPDQPIYLPIPANTNMQKTDRIRVTTGILMKRKIRTWIPWLIMIILFLMVFYSYYSMPR